MSTVCPVCNEVIVSDEGKCPSCGFKLLGTTEEFKPITLESSSTSVLHDEPRHAQTASLTIVRGAQIGTVYTLDDKILSIGRSPQCDIFLNDMTVSREHASVFPKWGGFVIRDSQSYNGIWINNESVEEARLENGDIVQIGAFCLKYEE